MTISSTDKEKIKRVVPKGSNKIIEATVARLFVAYPDPQEWTYTGLSGAIILVDDLVGNTFWLKLVDINGSRGILWDQEIYVDFGYNQDRSFFHSFEIEDCLVGLLFDDTTDASRFFKKVESRKKYGSKKTVQNKNAIALKAQQKEVVHAPGPRGDFNNNEFSTTSNQQRIRKATHATYYEGLPPPEWRSLYAELSAAGITESMIADNKEFIKDYIRQQGGPLVGLEPPIPRNLHNTLNSSSIGSMSSTRNGEVKKKAPPPPPSSKPFASYVKSSPSPIHDAGPGASQEGEEKEDEEDEKNEEDEENEEHEDITGSKREKQNDSANVPRVVHRLPPPPPSVPIGFQRDIPVEPSPRTNPPPPPPLPSSTLPIKSSSSAPPPPPRLADSYPRHVPLPPPRQSNMPLNQNLNSIPPPPPQRGPVPVLPSRERIGTPPAPPPPRRGTVPPPPPSRGTAMPPAPPPRLQQTQGNQPQISMPPVSSPVSQPLQPPSIEAMANPTMSIVSPPPPPPLPFASISTNPQGGAPPPPPPLPVSLSDTQQGSTIIPPPAALMSPASGSSRDDLLSSIRNAGGIGSLKKVDKSQLDRPSVILREGHQSKNNASPNSSVPPPNGGGSLADAIQAALNSRKSKVSRSDDESDGEEW